MKLWIISIGHERADAAAPLVADYLKRISKFLPIEEIVLKPERKERAAERLLAKVPRGALLVALDEQGKQHSSCGFAALLGQWMNRGLGAVSFVIGGAEGLPEEIKARADHQLSLSKMTLPHRLARLVLAEQLYRGLCILRNVPYQK